MPGWLWQAAIHQGFRAMYMLGENDGGYMVADLDARKLAYQKVLAIAPNAEGGAADAR